MKKKVIALVLSALMVTGLVGCGSDNNSSTAKEGAIKVGMVTDTGTIDDKSFNQGTWEGIKEVRIYDGYIIFVSKNSCVLNRIMTFDGFNVERDVIISDIEKYKEVRWYYNEF